MVGIQWEFGTVTKLFGSKGIAARPNAKAEILGQNGKVYLMRDSSLSPENTHERLRPGDRVKFEDRGGYPMDLRKV